MAYSIICTFLAIILSTEMTKPNVTELIACVVYESLTTLAVGEVTCIARHSFCQRHCLLSCNAINDGLYLQACAIIVVVVAKSFLVVVSFQYEIVALADDLCYAVGDVTAVGDEAEYHAFNLNAIACIVLAWAVVRHMKRCYDEISNCESLLLDDVYLTVQRNLLGNAVVLVDAAMHLLRCIYRTACFHRYIAYAFYMVCMVVSDKYALQTGHLHVMACEAFLDSANADSSVNHQIVVVCHQQVRIAATATSYCHKSNHTGCKVTNK